MSLGFQNQGFELVAGIDSWEDALHVYRLNFQHESINLDIKNLNESCTIVESLQPDMIIGGPPCQDFSHAGKRNEELGRADLTVSFAKIVAHVLPEWFVMENVARAIHSIRFQQSLKIFKDCNYGLTVKVLDAAFCGVPQYRKRVFVIGQRFARDNFLTDILDKNLSNKPLTVREVLKGQITTEYYYRHPRNYSRRAVYSIDEPSPTIRGVNRPIPKGYRSHPQDAAPLSDKVRPLTTKERSLIQTFPHDFIFEGTRSNVEQMIGNSVPVKLAEYVSSAIRSFVQLKEGSKTDIYSYSQLQLFEK